MVDSLVLILLVASSLLAFAVRRNAVVCLAALALLPAIPAGLRYALKETSILDPQADPTAMYLLLGLINYGSVWGGFLAGLIFDVLDHRRHSAPVPSVTDEMDGASVEDQFVAGHSRRRRVKTMKDAA